MEDKNFMLKVGTYLIFKNVKLTKNEYKHMANKLHNKHELI